VISDDEEPLHYTLLA